MSSRLSRALPLLVACAPLWFAGHAAAQHTVSASVCDAATPSATVASRFWGITNPNADSNAVVSCPMPSDRGSLTTYRIHGWAAPGASIPCTLRELEKLDGRLLAAYSFTITGSAPATVQPINHPTWVKPVAELLCTLPAKARGHLYTLETY